MSDKAAPERERQVQMQSAAVCLQFLRASGKLQYTLIILTSFSLSSWMRPPKSWERDVSLEVSTMMPFQRAIQTRSTLIDIILNY